MYSKAQNKDNCDNMILDKSQHPKNILVENYSYTFQGELPKTKHQSGRYVYRCSNTSKNRACKTLIHLNKNFDFNLLLVSSPNKNQTSDNAPTTTTKTPIYIPNDDSTSVIHPICWKFEGVFAPKNAPGLDEKTIWIMHWPHKCIRPSDELNKNLFDKDAELLQLKEYLYMNHNALYPLSHLAKQFPQISIHKISQGLKKSRDSLYPKSREIVLTTKFCCSLDSANRGFQSLYLGKGDIIDKRGHQQDFVIFGTRFSLIALSRAQIWYVDDIQYGIPQGYKQAIIVLINQANIIFPCLVILSTSKKEIVYTAAFGYIKSYIESLHLTCNIKEVMGDFERGPSRAIKSHFPNTEMKFCFFHFYKAIYNFCMKLELFEFHHPKTNESMISHTMLLITLIHISLYVDCEQTKTYIDELHGYYRYRFGNVYDIFFKEFKRNWMDKSWIVSIHSKNLNDRCNNICESFNRVFIENIGYKKPRLGLFVEKLKIIEYQYRKKVNEKMEKGHNQNQIHNQEIDLDYCQELDDNQEYNQNYGMNKNHNHNGGQNQNQINIISQNQVSGTNQSQLQNQNQNIDNNNLSSQIDNHVYIEIENRIKAQLANYIQSQIVNAMAIDDENEAKIMPFTYLLNFLEHSKNYINNFREQLRNRKPEGKFLSKMDYIAKNCYDYLACNELSETVDNEILIDDLSAQQAYKKICSEKAKKQANRQENNDKFKT